MVRKIENARERFGKAAMELFRTKGYSETTVLQIADAAGLNERTFFRYFIDKPEVLFWRADELESEVVDALAQAGDVKPLERVIWALEKASGFFDANRPGVIARHAVIAAHADFQERELMKMRLLAEAIAAALIKCGVPESTHRIAAETGIIIWRLAIEQWLNDPQERGFPHFIRSCQQELKAAVAD